MNTIKIYEKLEKQLSRVDGIIISVMQLITALICFNVTHNLKEDEKLLSLYNSKIQASEVMNLNSTAMGAC